MKKTVMTLIMPIILGMFSVNSQAEDLKDIDMHGFLSQGYMYTSDNNFFSGTDDGSFQFSEIGLNFGKDLTDKLRLGIQFFARDFGTAGNYKVKIDWAYGDYRYKDWLGFRVGKIKAPQGLYNETRDLDMLRTNIFLPQSVYPEILRDTDLSLLGVGLYGNVDLSKGGSLNYMAGIGDQNIDANDSTALFLMGFTGDVDTVENDSMDVESKYVGSLVWETPLPGLRGSWTISSTKLTAYSHTTEAMGFFPLGTKFDIDISRLRNNVFSLEYTWNDLVIVGEFIKSKKKVLIQATLQDLATKSKTDGWYVGSSYRFNEWFELGAYYSESYADKNDRDGDTFTPHYKAYFKDICLTTRFDINEYCVFKIEGHSFEGTNGLSPYDNPADSLGNRWTEYWSSISAKASLSF